jgi:hypothetical protein
MFKVGDKVRLIRRGIPTKEECGRRWARDWPKEDGLEVGDVCTVAMIGSDGTLQIEGRNLWYDPWYFELVGEEVLEPIDYKGCHPEIARALKAGNMIRCRVWDDGCPTQRITQVIGFNSKYRKYCTLEGDPYYTCAEPVSTRYRVKPPRAIMRVLKESGYVWNSCSWVWRSEENPLVFRPEMLVCCGKEVERRSGKWKIDGWTFDESWLEEIK